MNKVSSSLTLCFALLLFQTGCIQQIKYYKPPLSPILKRSYSIGKQQEAYVGASMVEFKNFTARKNKTMSPTTPFSLAEIGLNIQINADKECLVLGSTVVNRQQFTVIQLDSSQDYRGLVDRNGDLDFRILHGERVMPFALHINPAIKFIRGEDKMLDIQHRTAINFRLVYAGIDPTSIKITNQEFIANGFDAGDLIKSSFTEKLTYDRSSKIIRFRNLKIEVLEASNEKIVYRVIEDGLNI